MFGLFSYLVLRFKLHVFWKISVADPNPDPVEGFWCQKLKKNCKVNLLKIIKNCNYFVWGSKKGLTVYRRNPTHIPQTSTENNQLFKIWNISICLCLPFWIRTSIWIQIRIQIHRLSRIWIKTESGLERFQKTVNHFSISLHLEHGLHWISSNLGYLLF